MTVTVTLRAADSLAQVLKWAERWPCLDGDGDGELEIRPLYEFDDFGEAFDGELRGVAERIMNKA